MAFGKKKKTEDSTAESNPEEQKPKSSRMLLIAAALTCVLSLGGGFFLARMAYMNDAASFEPDYVDEEAKDETKEMAKKDDSYDGDKDMAEKPKKGPIVDPLAKDGHPAEEAMALKDKSAKDDEKSGDKDKDGEKKDGEAVVEDSGLFAFSDFLTNIQGFDVNGVPTKAFLKLNLVMVYRTDAGASALVREREPFIRDLFNSYLRGLSESDVRGMAGVLLVKSELLKRARAAVGSDLPQEILINDLIIQ